MGQDAGVPAGGASIALCQSVCQSPCHRHLDARACTGFQSNDLGLRGGNGGLCVCVHHLPTAASKMLVRTLYQTMSLLTKARMSESL
jgi:hypothetical protein